MQCFRIFSVIIIYWYVRPLGFYVNKTRYQQKLKILYRLVNYQLKTLVIMSRYELYHVQVTHWVLYCFIVLGH